MLVHLCYLLQPPSQRDEHKQHGWSIKEGDGVHLCPLYHGNQKNHHRVCERNRCCQYNQHIHIGRPVLDSFIGLTIEITPTDKLQRDKTGVVTKSYLHIFEYFPLTVH